MLLIVLLFFGFLSTVQVLALWEEREVGRGGGMKGRKEEGTSEF